MYIRFFLYLYLFVILNLPIWTMYYHEISINAQNYQLSLTYWWKELTLSLWSQLIIFFIGPALHPERRAYCAVIAPSLPTYHYVSELSRTRPTLKASTWFLSRFDKEPLHMATFGFSACHISMMDKYKFLNSFSLKWFSRAVYTVYIYAWPDGWKKTKYEFNRYFVSWSLVMN